MLNLEGNKKIITYINENLYVKGNTVYFYPIHEETKSVIINRSKIANNLIKYDFDEEKVV